MPQEFDANAAVARYLSGPTADTTLRASLQEAVGKNPDEVAQWRKTAATLGVPVDTAQAMPDWSRQQEKLAGFDTSALSRMNPLTAGFLSNPDNAAIAHDDVANLSALETAVMHVKDYSGALSGGLVGDAVGRSISGVSTLLDVGARTLDGQVRMAFGDKVANKFWYDPPKIGGVAVDPFASLRVTGKAIKSFGDWMKPPPERQTLGTDVAGGIGQIGGQIATHLLTGGMISGVTLFAQGADVMGSKIAKDIADPALKDTAIMAGASITAITEKYGLDKLLNRVPPEIKNRTLRFIADKVAAGGIEAGQELAEGILHDIARKTLTNKDAEIGDGVTREMTAAGLSAMIVRTALGVKGHARAKNQEEFVKALTDTAADSKLRQRMPEKFKSYLDQITQGGPVENIFVPADQFTTYFQSVGLDPSVEAGKLGIQNYEEASQAGTDLVIPTSDFVSQLSGTDHLQGLWEDLRFQQGDMTLRESADFARNADTAPIDDDVLKAMSGIVDPALGSTPAFQQVKDAITGELAGRFDAGTVESYATQYAAVITTLAERSGIDPVALAQKYDLRVDMPLPDALRQVAERIDTDLDPLLDRIRAGDFPKQNEVSGQSLSEFILNAGGLADSSEARYMDENLNRKPGQRKMAQARGLSLDMALEKAVEAGYFPGQAAEDLTETDLIDAIENDIVGKRRLSILNADDSMSRLDASLTSLRDYLDAIGVDAGTMTNAQIKTRLETASAADVAGVYDQAENTDKRGQIAIGADRKMRISLFEKANLSTFLHESGHFYLEVMGDLASEPDAAPGIHADYAAILKWMGVESRDQIGVEQHEQFARGIEAYLREGKAPSPELRLVFQKFRAWLKQIYQSLKKLNVELSPEIRAVFDRMYATDEQIDAAANETDFAAMLLTAKDAGMTEAEFAAYEASVKQAVEQGRERLQTKLMRELSREQKEWWKTQRVGVREQVAGEVDADPLYMAFNALAKGETQDGIAVKLARDDLVRLYGKEFMKRLPRGFQRVYAAEGGVDVDTAAEVLGYESGQVMVEALVNMKPRAALIDALTDERMVALHGDMRFDGTIADEAMAALHNDKREDVLRIELRAIRRKAAEVAPFAKAIKDQAKSEAVFAKKERDYERRWFDAEKNLALQMERGIAGEKIAQIRQGIADEKAALKAEKDDLKAGEQFVKDSLPQQERTGRTKAGDTFTFQAFDPAPMKRAAAGFIGKTQIKELRPQSYLLAERKASKASAKAMRAKDYMTAAQEKQRELFNHYLYLEAARVAEEVQRKAEWLQKQGGEKKRQALGLAGADYLEQVDDILERYEFKRVSLKQLGRRESLANWVNAQEALGHAVNVPASVLDDSRQVNWKQIPVDELRAVHDAVRNITHLSGLKNKLIANGKQRDFEAVKSELLAAVMAAPLKSTGELERPNEMGATVKQKGAALWRKFDAAHMKVEQLVEWLDDGNIDGAWARNFFDLADSAQTKEYDLHRLVTVALNDLRESMPAEWQGAMADRADFKLPVVTGPGTSVMKAPTRFTLLSIALNMGNEQNIQRLRDGNQMTDAQMAQVRNALSDSDWKFVQGAWDAIEQLWPEMAALEKRASGLVPEKVEAASFDVRDKAYRGGYFPLVYDSRISAIGERQVEGDKTVEAFVSNGFGRPTTNKGATKKRTEQVSQPLLLDLNEVIGGHVAKVVKDLSHRESVMGLHKILTDSDVKAALIDKLGEAYYRELRDWTKTLVNDRSDSMMAAKGVAKVAMLARTNLAIVTMGWKVSTMMAQFAGFGPSSDLVRPAYLGRALLTSTQSPRETWAMIAEKSGEMRNRVQTIDRDMRDAMNRLAGKRSLFGDVQRSAFIFVGFADRMVSVPTWLGAYTQALAEGQGEEAAVRNGDRAVRLSQGAGGAKDMAAVQRNNELMKLMTMYYTPFSALYARLRDVGHQSAVDGIGYLPTAVARTLALVIVPAILGDLLAGRGPDDDEDKVWWSVRKMLLYPLASLPGIRDFSGLIEQKIIAVSGEGQLGFMPSYNLSPIVVAISKAWNNLISKPFDVLTGDREFDGDMAWGIFESGGLVVGAPTAQVRITGEYLTDLMSGEAQPESAPEMLRDALFRRPKP